MAGLDDTARVTPLLEEAQALIAPSGVPVRTILKVSHRISQGIVETAQEENCNFVILGRQKNPTFLERFFSSTIDTVIQESPCEVGILHGEFAPEKIRNIFIPFGEDVHSRLATEIAPAFADHFKSNLRLGIVFEPETAMAEREEKLNAIRKYMNELTVPAKLQVVKDRDILQGVLRQSKQSDLILTGGRTGDFLELLLGKSLAQEITELSVCPVLWLKEYEERESFWASLFKTPETVGGENG
jgi:nucleotide-binding universal stress UspA family protein